jgi:hypothetical protein
MDLESLKIDRSAKKRRRSGRSPWVGRTVLVVVIVALVWAFYGPVARFLDRVRLPEVNVLRVEEPDPRAAGAVAGKAANGYVVAARRAALSADAPGRIVEMLVREGSVVKKGDVVARLYAEEYEAEVRRATSKSPARTSRASIASWSPPRPRSRPRPRARSWPDSSGTAPGASARKRSSPRANWTRPRRPSTAPRPTRSRRRRGSPRRRPASISA